MYWLAPQCKSWVRIHSPPVPPSHTIVVTYDMGAHMVMGGTTGQYRGTMPPHFCEQRGTGGTGAVPWKWSLLLHQTVFIEYCTIDWISSPQTDIDLIVPHIWKSGGTISFASSARESCLLPPFKIRTTAHTHGHVYGWLTVNHEYKSLFVVCIAVLLFLLLLMDRQAVMSPLKCNNEIFHSNLGFHCVGIEIPKCNAGHPLRLTVNVTVRLCETPCMLFTSIISDNFSILVTWNAGPEFGICSGWMSVITCAP